MKRCLALVLLLAACELPQRPWDRAEEWYKLAQETSDPARAVIFMDNAIQENPTADYHHYRARLRLALKMTQDAVNDYTVAIQMKRGDPAMHLGRGVALVRMGRARDAELDFSETLRLAPGTIDALLYRGRPADLEEARKTGSGLADGYYNEGVRALQQQEPIEAERMFRFALHLNPNHDRAHVALARQHMARRQFVEAAEELDKVLALNAELHYHRGNARFAAGRGEEALADYAKAVELDGAEALYVAARGMALHRVRKDLERAKANYDEAIRMDAGCQPAWYNRGLLLHEQRDLEGAERDLRKAASIRASPEGSVALGRVLHDRGAYDQALALYRGALDVYRDPESQKLLTEESARTRQAKEKR